MSPACKCTHLKDAHHPDGCMYCTHCTGFSDASTEWTEELLGLASTGLAMIKKDLERSGKVTPFFVLRHRGGSLEQLNVPENCAGLFNIGEAKTAIFNWVREFVRVHDDINAVLIATDCWMSRSTPKGIGLGIEEFNRIVRELGTEECARQGLLERREAATVTAQTPERVMTLSQAYERLGHRSIVFREITQIEGPIDKFAGRQKMFGTLDPEDQ